MVCWVLIGKMPRNESGNWARRIWERNPTGRLGRQSGNLNWYGQQGWVGKANELGTQLERTRQNEERLGQLELERAESTGGVAGHPRRERIWAGAAGRTGNESIRT